MNNGKPMSKSTWPIYLGICSLLILRALWRVFMPGGEWPMSPTHYLSMAVDLAMLGGLIGLNTHLSSALPIGDIRRATAKVLFWPALVAGIVLIIIRFTSKAAWWTGHLS